MASFEDFFLEEYIPVLVWRRRSDRPVSAESLHALQSVSGAAQWVSVQHWLLTRLACADSARLRHMNQPALTTAPLLSSLALIKLSNSRKMTSFSLCVYSSLHSTIVQFERRKQQKSPQNNGKIRCWENPVKCCRNMESLFVITQLQSAAGHH